MVHLQNATAAVNTVLNSVELRPGDLVLTTSISYAAVSVTDLHRPVWLSWRVGADFPAPE